MALKIERMIYRPISISERFGSIAAGKCSISGFKLKRRLNRKEKQNLLPLLLRVMDLFLCLSKDYRKNIEKFEGKYFLETRDGASRSGVIFGDGFMKIFKEGVPFPDVKITFKDLQSLLQFILSSRQDMLELIINNSIDINGNFNLALKFWFMVRELKGKLGLET